MRTIQAITHSLAVVVGVAVTAWWCRSCQPAPGCPEVAGTFTEVRYVHDTVVKTLPAAPAAVRIIKLAPVPAANLPVPAHQPDSCCRLLAERHVVQGQYRDSAISLAITDTIGVNRLLGRSISYQLLRPVAMVYTTTNVLQPPPRVSFLAGGSLLDNGRVIGLAGLQVQRWQVQLGAGRGHVQGGVLYRFGGR